MSMFGVNVRGLKVNDTVIRILPPSSAFSASIWQGCVVEVNDKTVICEVVIDCYRRMEFNRDNGLCVNGTESFIVPFNTKK